MTEEYDIFSSINDLCDNNLLAKFKNKATPVSNDDKFSSADEDVSIIEYIRPTRRAKAKKASSPNRNSPSPPLTNLLPAPTKKKKSITPEPTATGARRTTRSMNKSKESIVEKVTQKPPAKGRGKKSKTSVASAQVEVDAAINLNQLNIPELPTNPIQQMWTRRALAARTAAESTNVAYVDLVSSPVPRIEGVINVDSDNEDATKPVSCTTRLDETSSLDLSFDEDNPELSVKINWNGQPEIFKLRKYQKFAHIFTVIAQRENTEEKNLVFNIKNKIINANDTPASINYKIFEFINGRILVSKYNSPILGAQKQRDRNKIALKIQSDQWKRPLHVELLKTDTFKILYIKCGEELNIPYDNLKLSFDGEPLAFSDTPADADLEGGEAIDLRIKK